MAIVSFPEMILDGRSINLNPYSVENPHPGFGKDPNILNELGHTKYPMWVNGQLANNEEEENALRNPEAPKAPKAVDPNAPKWPTV
jgi:hypothetical protein